MKHGDGPPSVGGRNPDLEPAIAKEFGDDTEPDPVWPIVNVTTVSPYAPTLDPSKVQLPFWLWIAVIMCAAFGLTFFALTVFVG